MLIGAARRLAHHLAVIRTGDDEPGPDHVRHALRDVVRHCIYGVDVNDMAVELCKVALWMETLEPGKPLGFLDAHIRHGNSLVGVTSTDDLAEGIPDDAYSAKTGDDKAAAREIKRRNKKERTSLQHTLFEGHPEDDLLAEWHAFLAAPEETPQQIADKDARYAELRRPGGPWDRLQTACHLWTAAFFAEYTGDKRTDERIATTADLRAYLAAPASANEEQIAYARDLAKRHAFFHWSLEFPDVCRQGGFDVILSNPPWERIKLQEKEWFAGRAPEIANAPNAAARRKLIARLAQEDPALYAAFEADKHGAESESHFVRTSPRFPRCGRGDVNTYAVFAELVYRSISPRGRAGVIVPTGIATDDTTKYYFQDIMQTQALASLYDFENRRRIFPAVDSRIKFCLMTLTGNQHPAEAAEFVFFAQDVADLREEDRRFTLSAEEIALLNPNTRTCPIFRSKRDAELTKAIYRRVPVLVKEGTPEENPWGINFLRMFDMSNDSHLFRTRQQLEADGWRLEGNVFVKEGVGSGEIGSRAERYLPLYEAKMFHHFDHRWATYEETRTRDLSTDEHNNPQRLALPRYWVPNSEVQQRIADWQHEWLFTYRDISRATDERTAIATIIRRGGTACHLCLPSVESARDVGPLVASFCATVVDFVVRQKIGGTHLNFFYVKQFPILPPETYDQPCPWAGAPAASAPTAYLPTPYSLSAWLLPRVLELTYTAWDLEPFARDVMREIGNGERRGDTGDDASASAPYSPLPPFRWDEERRFLLRCELDAAYFHLYGIARDDVAYILETFPIVKRKDMAAYGEYRTQRVILEIYDEMAEAMAGGAPYQTRLDPPPADPRVAHPPKAR